MAQPHAACCLPAPRGDRESCARTTGQILPAGIPPGHEVNVGATRRTGKDEVLRTGLSSTCFHRDTGGFLEGRWEGRRDKWMPQLPKIPQQVSIDLPYLATRAAATVCGAGSIQPGRTGRERHFYGKAKPSGGSILIFRAPAESRKTPGLELQFSLESLQIPAEPFAPGPCDLLVGAAPAPASLPTHRSPSPAPGALSTDMRGWAGSQRDPRELLEDPPRGPAAS